MNRTIENIGAFFTVTFALSCGATNAWALVSLNAIPNLILSWMLPILLFSAVTGMNIYIFKRPVPKILYDIFGKGTLLQGLITKNGRSLSRIKIIMVITGLVFSLSAGITMAALAYQGISHLMGSMFLLQFFSPMFMPISILLASATLICITSLMLEAIASIIKTDDIWRKIENFFYDLVDISSSLSRNQNKSRNKIIFERIITVMLIIIFIPLACAGLIMTTNACCAGLATLVGGTFSAIIAYGFSMTAQIPFTLNTMANAVANLFEPMDRDDKVSSSCDSTIKYYGFQCLRFIYAVGNGLIAMLGANTPIQGGIAAGGGIVNSIAATSDTTMILERLGSAPSVQDSPLRDDSTRKSLSEAPQIVEQPDEKLFLHVSNSSPKKNRAA